MKLIPAGRDSNSQNFIRSALRNFERFFLKVGFKAFHSHMPLVGFYSFIILDAWIPAFPPIAIISGVGSVAYGFKRDFRKHLPDPDIPAPQAFFDKPVKVRGIRVTRGARAAIEAAGGSIEE